VETPINYRGQLLTLAGLACVIGCGGFAKPTEKLTVLLRPLGQIDIQTLKGAKSSVEKRLRILVEIGPALDLPRSAYTKPRNRYRADKLWSFLETTTPKKYSHVIGLTSVDVSTKAHGYDDWGIFGYGQIDGRPCVVSTFRLRKPGGKSPSERLGEIVVHETGHTHGLEHCPTPRCVMNDAEGSIKSVDKSTGEFCTKCKARLGGNVR